MAEAQKKLTDEELALIQRKCQESLQFLCKSLLWRFKPANLKMWGNVHTELESFLNHDSRRKHVELARGHLKSEIVTKCWAIQQMLRDPNIRILIANATWDNARKFLRSIQQYIGQGQLLEQYFGRFVSAQWNQDECTIRQRTVISDAPTFATGGLEKEQTGQHYDIIILDDLVARENVQTPEQREKVKQYYRDCFALLEPGGTLVVVGTRWHQDDLYSMILEDKTFDLFIRSVYRDTHQKELEFPEKFSLAQLDDMRRPEQMGSYHFAAQMMNNPVDPSTADFKEEWIRTFELGSKMPSSLYMTVDPAASLSRDADYTAMVVAGQFEDKRIRVVDYFHGRVTPDQLIDELFKLVVKWNLHRVGVESFAFQKTLQYGFKNEMHKRGIFFSIDEVGKKGAIKEHWMSKEARIRRLVPYFEQGMVEIRPDMHALKNELLSFPRGRHDDLCLVAGTKIATLSGDKTIEDVRPGDHVLTPFGPRKVTGSKNTGKRKTMRAAGLEGTPNHPVFVYGPGFVPMDALTCSMEYSKLSLWELCRWAYRNLLISMDGVSGSWERENIISASQQQILGGRIRKDFMRRSGNFIRAGQFQKALKLTIETATRLIMTTATWSVYRFWSIAGGPNVWSWRKSGVILTVFDPWLRGGTLLRKDANGTANMPGPNGSIRDCLTGFARNAEKLISRFIPMELIVPALAESAMPSGQAAMLKIESASSANALSEHCENTLKANVAEDAAVISSIGEEEKQVYNLSVEKNNSYFANGVLVHNCDALAMQLDFLIPSYDAVPDQAVKPGTFGELLERTINREPQGLYARFFADMREPRKVPVIRKT